MEEALSRSREGLGSCGAMVVVAIVDMAWEVVRGSWGCGGRIGLGSGKEATVSKRLAWSQTYVYSPLLRYQRSSMKDDSFLHITYKSSALAISPRNIQ